MAIEITPTGTNLQISKSDKFDEVINTDNGTYRLSQEFVKDELPFGVTLYARARHNAEETGYSKWSKTVSFHVEVPALIIGVAIDTSASPATVHYIDLHGEKLESPDLVNHPAFKGITMATMDSSRAPVTMTKFPKFYIKTAASGPSGTFAEGKLCYWISDIYFEGFRIHPAFKRLTTQNDEGKYNVSDYVYIGTFMGHSESASGSGTVLGSKQNMSVATGSSSYTRSNLLQYCKNRNNSSSSQSGWRAFDIWDVSLLRWLGVLWKGSFNFQSVYGTNSSSSPRTGSTQCRLVFKGTQSSPEVWIDDLWSTYWQHVNLITVSSGRVSLISPMNGSSSISIGGSSSDYTMSTSSGYIKSFCSASFVLGDDNHDILELFLPKTVVGSESSSLAPDYYNYNTDTSYMKIGGYWSNGSQGGIFSSTNLNEYYQESYQSYEIIRYETVQVPGTWPSSKRCGLRFNSRYDILRKSWVYNEGTTNGESDYFTSGSEQRVNCSLKYGPYRWNGAGSINIRDAYVAVCAPYPSGAPAPTGPAINSFIESYPCPKGWGKNKNYTKSSGVQYAQGYVKGGTEQRPVYGYVTRYRDAYYNYVATRIAKS